MAALKSWPLRIVSYWGPCLQQVPNLELATLPYSKAGKKGGGGFGGLPQYTGARERIVGGNTAYESGIGYDLISACCGEGSHDPVWNYPRNFIFV